MHTSSTVGVFSYTHLIHSDLLIQATIPHRHTRQQWLSQTMHPSLLNLSLSFYPSVLIPLYWAVPNDSAVCYQPGLRQVAVREPLIDQVIRIPSTLHVLVWDKELSTLEYYTEFSVKMRF